MKQIQIELSDDRAFDDLVNLDCIHECMHERIADSDCFEDQAMMRKWVVTLNKLRHAYENVVMEVEK